LCRPQGIFFPRTTCSVREAWSTPTSSSSPPVDRRAEAKKVEPAVAVEHGLEAAGVRASWTTRHQRYLSKIELLSDGVPVRRRAKAEVVEPAVAAKRRVEAAGGRHAA
jgi:hypothetical protein